LKDKNYEEAMIIFGNLGLYEDAAELAVQAKYLFAMVQFEEGNYAKAKENFEQIIDYKDSADMGNECEYQIALQAMSEKEYEKAIKRLANVQHEDKVKLLTECYYNLMLLSIEKGKMDEAYEFYMKVVYRDREGKYDLSPYRYDVYMGHVKAKLCSEDLVEVKMLKKAVETLEREFDNQEVREIRGQLENRINELSYKSAINSFNNGEYRSAVDMFEGIINYKNSKDMWLESMYLYLVTAKLDQNWWDWMKSWSTTAHDYAKTLVAYNYKDSLQLYNELF